MSRQPWADSRELKAMARSSSIGTFDPSGEDFRLSTMAAARKYPRRKNRPGKEGYSGT